MEDGKPLAESKEGATTDVDDEWKDKTVEDDETYVSGAHPLFSAFSRAKCRASTSKIEFFAPQSKMRKSASVGGSEVVEEEKKSCGLLSKVANER